jgi:hypothetical protein
MLFKDNTINFTSLFFSVHSKKNNNSKDSYVNFPVTYFFLFTRKILLLIFFYLLEKSKRLEERKVNYDTRWT